MLEGSASWRSTNGSSDELPPFSARDPHAVWRLSPRSCAEIEGSAIKPPMLRWGAKQR
jgi:hypothetical protein